MFGPVGFGITVNTASAFGDDDRFG
jgi:hypothetical protein